MSYLIDKFKGQYRLMVEYDRNTNQFNRKANGTFEDIDVYIDCANNTRVFYFGDGLLECYVMSLGRGRNVIKNIYSDFVKDIESSKYMTVKEASGKKTTVYDYESLYKDKDLNEIITGIYETDEEVIFKFYWDKMEMFEKYLKPKIAAANRSPFSRKNLPKSQYIIPDNDLGLYKNILIKYNPDNLNVLEIAKITKNFIKTKKCQQSDDRLSGKELIHANGLWEEYIEYLTENLIGN